MLVSGSVLQFHRLFSLYYSKLVEFIYLIHVQVKIVGNIFTILNWSQTIHATGMFITFTFMKTHQDKTLT